MALTTVKLKGTAVRGSLKRRKQLELDLEHVTQEMYRRNKELAETNRTLSLLRTIDSLVLESHDSIKVLCNQMAEAIIGTTEYPFVAFLGPTKSHSGLLELYSWKAHDSLSVEPELLEKLKPSMRHDWFKAKVSGSFLSLLHPQPEKLASFLGCSVKEAGQIQQKLPLKSVYIVKLRAREQMVGVMVVGSLAPMGDFKSSEADLLDRLSETLGIALDNRLLFEENQIILAQLQKTNRKLRELDKTKDEFISMASHQLRTPLTSIKGYLSMILEGDVGPVKKNQKEYVQRAFDSAQRMVYLIADMLNVSRLQNGKFVIENKETDLAKSVEEQIAQVQATAEAKQLKLNFHKPDNLPALNLDQTKIEQVIMNFLDNAIYYTPAGGTVTVELSATGKEVIFSVTDTGVGVPASVQHHLFSKFYRADNARKIRPDGTGLGLFMAKKVISAQGGAIIFKSTEGKGSTFGFSFPKSATKMKDAAKPPEPSPAKVAK